MSAADLSPVGYSRADCAGSACSEFVGGARDFSRQYYRIYTVRLGAARDRLRAAALGRWGDSLPLVPLHQLQENTQCAVIGTLFKRQSLQPSILRELSEEHALQPAALPERFLSAEDSLVLEDELARVRLDGDVDPQVHVTGVVCALRGQLLETGRFHVSDVCYRPLRAGRPAGPAGGLVLLVSGLGVSGAGGGGDLALLQLLCDVVAGHVGGQLLQQKMARVVSVIVAGNSLHADTKDRDCMTRPAYLSSETAVRSAEAVRVLDGLLAQLAACCRVQLMPGQLDPSSHMWPQLPFHRCLLPSASAYSTLERVGNPHAVEVAGCVLVGSSGQNVTDLYRFSRADNPLVALRRLLQWSHLCPSAPDTLACHPFSDTDPFLLDACPNVLFAGNQPSFASEVVRVDLLEGGSQEVRLISVPVFASTGSAVLLDTSTLQTEEINIGSQLS